MAKTANEVCKPRYASTSSSREIYSIQTVQAGWVAFASIVICVPVCIHSIDIKLDTLTPIINLPYKVRATLKLHNFELDKFQSSFIFKGPNDNQCILSNWKFCNDTSEVTDPWHCKCSSHRRMGTGSSRKYHYRFFVFLGIVKMDMQGESYSASLGNEGTRTAQLEVVDFARRPAPNGTIFMCQNEDKELDWLFTINTNDIEERFQWVKIEWLYRDTSSDTTQFSSVASVSRHSNGTIQDKSSTGISLINLRSLDFFRLKLEQFANTRKVQFKIVVSFNRTKFVDTLKAQNNLYSAASLSGKAAAIWDEYRLGRAQRVRPGNSSSTTPQTCQHGINKHTGECLSTHTSNTTTTSATTTTTTSTTTTTTTSTTTTTTTSTTTTSTTDIPDRNYPLEEDQLGALRDVVTLEPIIAPSPGTEVKLTVAKSPTKDALMINCKIARQTHTLGTPPVNVTVWTQIGNSTKRELDSRVAGVPVRFDVPTTLEETFSCGLVGIAMDCVPDDDPRKKRVHVNSSEIEGAHRKKSLSPWLFVYCVEVFIVLTFTLSIVGNCLEHIRLVMWNKRMELDETLRMQNFDKPFYKQDEGR